MAARGEAPDRLQAVLDGLERPVLVLSTAVGRGMVSLGEALVERLGDGARGAVLHRTIEEFLPGSALGEDVLRYRAISSHAPWLLHLVYRFPPIYWRKLFRERHVRRTDLGALEAELRERGVRTVLCVSHRPAFWAAGLREARGLDVRLAGLLGEYGRSLGWRYIPWTELELFLSPVSAEEVGFRLPPGVRFERVELPARRAFRALGGAPGDPREVLVVCGSWGQGAVRRAVRELVGLGLGLRVHAVCGDNARMLRALEAEHGHGAAVACHGSVPSLAPLLARCAAVVTKPGIATLVEARAAGRKLFLLRGMPVAEDNNARYALARFGAEPFHPEAFRRWLEGALAAAPERGGGPAPRSEELRAPR